MKRFLPPTELDIVPLFRVFLVIFWGYLTVTLFVPQRHPPPPVPDTMLHVEWVQTGVLLGYLVWSGGRRRLGRAYLPVALSVLGVGPVLWQALGTAVQIHNGVRGDAALVDPNRLYLWLLLPLLLISVHCRLRIVLLFTLGTSLLSLVLIAPLARLGDFSLMGMLTNAGDRALIFSVAGAIIVQLSKAQRRVQTLLVERQEELARYALVVEQLAVSRERNRIAREMHDTLAHTLSAVSVQLGAAEVQWATNPAAARATVGQAAHLTRMGLDEARRALHALRASPVEALGLGGAVRHLAEEAAARGGFALECSTPPSLPHLHPDLEQGVYRIADEALTNVVRHAAARHVGVQLVCAPASLSLQIRDDGVGFDAAQPEPPGHFGVMGMTERARLLGGTLAITSARGSGTTIHLTVPTA